MNLNQTLNVVDIEVLRQRVGALVQLKEVMTLRDPAGMLGDVKWPRGEHRDRDVPAAKRPDDSETVHVRTDDDGPGTHQRSMLAVCARLN